MILKEEGIKEKSFSIILFPLILSFHDRSSTQKTLTVSLLHENVPKNQGFAVEMNGLKGKGIQDPGIRD